VRVVDRNGGGCGSTAVQSILRLRSKGILVVAITNNWKDSYATGGSHATALLPNLKLVFDHFIESAMVGIRKPNKRIYQIALEQSGKSAEQCIFIDDIGTHAIRARAPASEWLVSSDRNDVGQV